MIAVGVAILLAVLLAALAFVWTRGLRGLVKDRVVLHTTDGHSIRGVVIGVYRDSIVLGHTAYLDEAREAGLEGDVLVPREKIAWIQRLGSES